MLGALLEFRVDFRVRDIDGRKTRHLRFDEIVVDHVLDESFIVIDGFVGYAATARARDGVSAAHSVLQTLADFDEQLIAGCMSEAVIDDLEFVDGVYRRLKRDLLV